MIRKKIHCFFGMMLAITIALANGFEYNNKLLKQILKLSQKQSNTIYFRSKQFDTFIRMAKDQPYAIAMLVTAKDKVFGCTTCAEVEESFKKVAALYAAETNVSKVSAQALNYFNEKPLFFVVLDADNAREIFIEFKLNNVPFLQYFPHGVKKWSGTLQDSGNDVLDIVGFINHEHKISLPLPLKHYTELTVPLALVGVFCFLGLLISYNLDGILRLPWNSSLWLLVSLGIFGASVGGMIFCIIRSTPWYIYQGKKKYYFIYPTNRQQLVLEGLFIAFIQLGIGFLFVILHHQGRKKGVFNWLKMTMMIAGVIYLVQLLFEMYTFKEKWYSINTTLPPWIPDFSITKLVNSWLRNYSSWKIFQQKLIKYIKI